MLGGWLTSMAWLLLGWTQELGNADLYPFGIEPMYPGVLVSLCIWSIGLARKTNQRLAFLSEKE